MELIKEILNGDIGLETKKKDKVYNLRKSARIILVNENKEITILKVARDGYHKLPGGRIEKNESKIEAAHREVKEETGYDMKMLDEVGLIIEYADDTNLMQISYCYFAKALDKGVQTLTENEIEEGIGLIWVDFKEAINIIKTDKPQTYAGQFIRLRELSFLEKAYEIFKNKYTAII